MGVKFSNNAATTLASGISNSATSATVASAADFPTVGGSVYAYLTIASVTTSAIDHTKLNGIATGATVGAGLGLVLALGG